MEVVSNLRQISDALRANAERLLHDVQSIHSRMLSQLQEVEARIGDADRVGTAGPEDAPAGPRRLNDSAETAPAEDELEVPDFISPG